LKWSHVILTPDILSNDARTSPRIQASELKELQDPSDESHRNIGEPQSRTGPQQLLQVVGVREGLELGDQAGAVELVDQEGAGPDEVATPYSTDNVD